MQEKTKNDGRRLLAPLVRLLVRLRVHPTAITLAALPLSFIAAGLFASGRFVWAGVAQALAGICDVLDGQVSRQSGRTSASGAFIDSTTDRLNEAVVLAGIAWYYMVPSRLVSLLAIAALVLSLMVSYVRARAEGVGRDCRVGFFERPVRVLVLVFGAVLLGPRWMPVVLGVIALGSLATIIQRVVYVLRQSGGRA